MLLKIPAPGAIREAAQLVPGTRHRQTGRKGSCRGFPSLPAEITRESSCRAARRHRGRCRGDPEPAPAAADTR